MSSINWKNSAGEWGDVGSLLLSGEQINLEDSEKDNAYLEILPAVMNYTYAESETGHTAAVNLGNDKRKFGKMYAESFEGAASHVDVYDSSSMSTNSYSFSLDGTTLTLTKTP